MAAQRPRYLFATEVEGAHGDRFSIHPAHQRRENRVLFFLAREVVAVHVEELGANEAEPHRTVGQRLLQFDR